MTDRLSPEAEQKKKCCEQSFLGSVAGLKKDGPKKAGPVRRAVGLALLCGVHLFMLAWSGLWSIFQPRYRRVLPFQWRYFMDVMAREMGKKKTGAP